MHIKPKAEVEDNLNLFERTLFLTVSSANMNVFHGKLMANLVSSVSLYINPI